MTDPNNRTPAPDGGSTDEPNTRPASDEATAPHDPIADRDAGVTSGGEAGGADPDALDQSLGRGAAGQGDARTRDGAI